MKSLFKLFVIRKSERAEALLALLFALFLNIETVLKYAKVFIPLQQNYFNLFVGKFHISGFDPLTYYVVSAWEARYNVYRHPLLSFLMWPVYMINRGLMALFGMNFAQFLVAILAVFASVYAVIFLLRTLKEVVGLGRIDAALLGFWFCSFAYIMLTMMVPDHFVWSMMLLLMVLYVTGKRMNKGMKLGVWETAGLFFAVAGVSLNNGIKVFLAALFANKRRFFRPKFLLIGVIFPALLLWIGARYEYHYLVAPAENARHQAKKARQEAAKKAEKTLQMHTDTAQMPTKKAAKKPGRSHKGAPIMDGEFMRWTDITTPRWASIVENLGGESLMLHPDWLLQDAYRNRPIIVKYRWMGNYLAEGLVALLFLLGVWAGRKSRFLWLCLSFMALDMGLHVGLGFGINEVYIMSGHWLFVVPLSVSYLFLKARRREKTVLRGLIGLLAVGFYIYNLWLLLSYM